MSNEFPHDPVMTAAEVAVDLRCSKAHVYKLLDGQIPGVMRLPVIRIGRRRLVRRSSLERWKSASEQHSDDMLVPSPKVSAVDA